MFEALIGILIYIVFIIVVCAGFAINTRDRYEQELDDAEQAISLQAAREHRRMKAGTAWGQSNE